MLAVRVYSPCLPNPVRRLAGEYDSGDCRFGNSRICVLPSGRVVIACGTVYRGKFIFTGYPRRPSESDLEDIVARLAGQHQPFVGQEDASYDAFEASLRKLDPGLASSLLPS